MDVKGVVVQVLESGTEFGAYRIEGLLGRGGMSEVYRASNPRLGNTIAVKLLTRELANDEIFRERFVRESRLAASLNHPNVIPIFDAGESNGMPYIAMRYVEGSDLEQLLGREGPLSAAATASIVGQIAAALDCAHSQGLIHRDVKPANILIEGDDDAHVYLSDFGVAKHGGSRSGLTSTGHFVGTVDYIAPEQIEGKPVSGATDVYSLGCVLYQCLTAEPPFDRDSDVAMIYAHLVEPPPLVSERRPDLPVGLDAVVSKALSKRPEDRYGTCRELVAALRAAVGLEAAQTLGGAATADDTATRLADGPALPAVPETILAADSAMPRSDAAPPTELASSLTAPSPSAGTELTAAAPPTPPTGLSPAGSERKTVSMRRLWRSKRLLIAAAVALLVAGGAAAAAQTLGGGSSKKHGGAGSNQAGSANNGSDIAGDGVAVNADGKTKGGKTTTQKSKKQTSSTGKKKTKKASTTNSALSSRRSSSSKSGSTGSTLNSRRSSSGTSSSSAGSKSTSSTLSSRRAGTSGSSSSGSTSGTLSSRRKGK